MGESVVSMMINNWEVESSHLYDIKDWKTMDISVFQASLNEDKAIDAQRMADIGRYNMLLGDADGYKASANTLETAEDIFSAAFPEGFAWEILEVLSGPPDISFKWRHFGKFTGKYTDASGEVHQGNGKHVNFYGNCIARVSGSLAIENIKFYHDPSALISQLMSNKHPKADSSAGLCLFSSGACTKQ